jgi:hypothetical protein
LKIILKQMIAILHLLNDEFWCYSVYHLHHHHHHHFTITWKGCTLYHQNVV